MKNQFKSQLFCVCVLMLFILSCKKEKAQPECSTLTAFYTTTNEVLTPPPMLQQRVSGTGHSTHLGLGRHVALSTIDLTTPPPFKIAGTATFYAADGDAFYTVFSGTASPNSDGTSNVVINHDISGGTGSFRNATGKFGATAISDPRSPTTSTTSEGSICY